MAIVKRYEQGAVTRPSGGNWTNNPGPTYPGQSSAPFAGSVAKDGYAPSPGTKAGGMAGSAGGPSKRNGGNSYT